MAEIIITSSPSTSLQGSPVLRPVDDLPTSTTPNRQPDHDSAYLFLSTNKSRQSTPVRNTQQTFIDYSASPPPLANELYLALDAEMRQAFVGPLTVETFFKDFLPIEDIPPPSTSPGFTDMARATSEKQMYGSFVSAVNSLFTRFTAFDTSNTPSSEAEAEYKPDVTIYEGKEEPPTRTVTSFQTMEMFVEFKHGNSADPFVTEDKFFPKLFNNTSASRGQIALYSTRQQAYQFRTSIFNVGIFGKVARLFRWDRTGCKVTAPIDYSTEKGNRHLTEFFLRLDRMADDPEARGWDPTVKDATVEETEDFAEAVKAACEVRPEPEQRMTRRQKKQAEQGRDLMDPMLCGLVKSVGDPSEYPRRKISIPDGRTRRDYIVGRPTSVLKAPTGRATRGFVAMSVKTKQLVFLKDSWRPDVEGIQPEDHWYRLLRKRNSAGCMKNIGAYSHGTDVYATRKFVRCPDKKQRTITRHYAAEYGCLEAMMGYVHHRVVLSELYLPLEAFRGSKHFTKVMCDIAIAIEHVHKVGAFHRDLSLGNIMIDVNGNGRLIDFDLARLKDETGARQTMRTGTWQFTSTAQLLDPGKAYEVSDELESFFFVVLYVGVHWVTHNKPCTLDVKLIFDDVRVNSSGRQTGGLGKQYMYIKGGVILQHLEFTKSPPFTDLIRGLFRLFQSLAIVNCDKDVGRDPRPLDIANVDELKNCKAVIQLMKNAMNRKDWPEEHDKAANDNYPRKEEIDKEDRVGLANLKVTTAAADTSIPGAAVPLPASKASKRGREGDDGHATPAKRSRVETV